ARAAHVVEEGGEADVVEAEAVDDRFARGQPEKARPRIAGLRPRRHGAHFEKPKTEGAERLDVLGVLVEAGGEADRIRELEAHRTHRRARHTRRNERGEGGAAQGEMVAGFFVE